MHKVLVSRCLLGHPVRYDGGALAPSGVVERWCAEGRIVALCPEVAGGLPTPRAPAEIRGGQGAQVLDGLLPVLSIDGEDVSAAFRAGAEQALELVERHGIRVALLKANSPSCGNHETYDGSFNGRKVSGEGVTAALLRRAGVQVFNEHELQAADARLRELDSLA
ncbi:2-thiouracil desulfurase family protein [Phytopseudomonas dryadis]|uniref:DUF523 domain-containing protein n=1 Tax=Phytopseudomonas dryadis TaxID=2487520 RepID=A0ABY1Z357_9GAMM|nr:MULTISPECIES: DUF523 domain-containing protein [Pseudomonas]TBV03047.1 DUF523 domain-containing protein [Pseudomonas dryadis]TBV17676.1 DUF523 domain-containing protein [Pseudomonas sp. FRB 230]